MSDRQFWNAAGVVIFFFALSLVTGVLLTARNPEIGAEFLQLFKDAIMGEIIDNEPLLLAVKLFLNNLQACILLFLGGATFGVLTFFIIGTNGLVIGAIIELVREQQSLTYVLAAIVPHGIFEIPAFIISATLGVLLARSLWKELYRKADAAGEALRLARVFLTVVIPLVAIAAFTEAFITPEIIRLIA
jgi:stage II sporulation protein M